MFCFPKSSKGESDKYKLDEWGPTVKKIADNLYLKIYKTLQKYRVQ